MLKEKVEEKLTQTRFPLTLTYNRIGPNILKVIQKYWNLLSIHDS